MRSRRTFTPDEDAIIRGHADGTVSVNQLRTGLRCNIATVRRRAAELGIVLAPRKIPRPRRKRKGAAGELRLLRMHYGSRHYEELAI